MSFWIGERSRELGLSVEEDISVVCTKIESHPNGMRQHVKKGQTSFSSCMCGDFPIVVEPPPDFTNPRLQTFGKLVHPYSRA